LTIINSTINDNNGGHWGGGIYTESPTTIENSTIFNNFAAIGGGLEAVDDDAIVSIMNSTITTNSCTMFGAGVYMNTGSTLNICNTILVDNGNSDYYVGTTLPTLNDNGYNIVQDQVNGGSQSDWHFTHATNILRHQYTDGSVNYNGDWIRNDVSLTNQTLDLPSTLADNDTENGTQTLALGAGSFAIDAGTDVNAPEFDQRGFARYGITDIGAYEFSIINAAPIANDIEIITDEDIAVAITLTGSDADGDELTFTIVDAPTNGVYADGIYTPNAGFVGTDTFTYVANDGTVDSELATVTITVNEVIGSYIVMNAGSDEVNGTYVADGTNYDGEPRWKHESNSYYLHSDGMYTWVISENGDWVDEHMNMYYALVWDGFDANQPPSTGWECGMNGMQPAPTVSEASESLSYSSMMFQESELDDGTITNTITITHNNFEEASFTGVNGDNFVADGKLIISNVPTGLTVATTRIDDLTLEVELTGSAVVHDNVNEPLMTFSFQNNAFTSGDASLVTGSTEDVSINFVQEYYVASSGGDFALISDVLAACGNGDVINLAGETFTEAGLTSDKSITIQGQGAGVTIVQAHATYGAATNRVFYLTGEDIAVSDMTIRHGKHAYAAGMWVHGTDVSLVNLEICDNRAEDSANQLGPAGLMAASYNLATIENCTIHNNITHGIGDGALAEGGGLRTGGGGNVLVKNTTITNNVCENATYLRGGAIYLNAGMTTIVNSTVMNNSSGIYANGKSLTMHNTIVVDNAGDDVHAAYGLYLTNLGYNVVENQTAVGVSPSLFTQPTDILYNYMADGTASTQWTRNNVVLGNQNLNLSTTLADNDTEIGTQTLALLEGSFAIDAGTDVDAPEFDQRGFGRNGVTDIGAYEFDGITVNEAIGSYIVMNAGSDEVNGTYNYYADYAEGYPMWKHASAEFYLYLDGGYDDYWVITEYSDDPDYDYAMYYNENQDPIDAYNPPISGWEDEDGDDPMPNVYPAGELLFFSETIFQESQDNNGMIESVITITHNNWEGSIFTGTNGDDFIADGKLTISNIPDGLTASVVKLDDLILEVALSGVATSHNNADDISLTFAFQSSALSSGNTEDLYLVNEADLAVNFINEYYVASVGGDFTVIAEALNACDNGDVITLAGETFTESGLVVDKSITLQGQGAGISIVQAHAEAQTATDRIFTIDEDYAGNDIYVLNVLIQDITIRNGVAPTYGDGGGIFMEYFDTVKLLNVNICNNSVNPPAGYGRSGGGIYKGGWSSNLILENCTFSGNICHSQDRSVAYGGAIYGYGNVSITNCTFTNNTTENATYLAGGAIRWNGDEERILSITNSTISGNSSGIAVNYGTVRMQNSIVAGNNNMDIQTMYGITIEDLGYNIVEYQTIWDGSPTNWQFTNPTSILYNYMADGTASTQWTRDNIALANQNLNLSTTLADNDTENGTQTLALGAGSFAIDAGTDVNAPEFDQRGFARCGITDIGAYEFSIINAAPVAEDIAATTNENTPVEITLLGSDADGDELMYVIEDFATNGILDFSEEDNNIITYTPNAGFVGTDTFTYFANDGTVDSEFATVTITVNDIVMVVDQTPLSTIQETGTQVIETVTISNTGEGTLNYSIVIEEQEEVAILGEFNLPLSQPTSVRNHAKTEKKQHGSLSRKGITSVKGSGGPDEFGYSWKDSDEEGGPIFNWIDISSTGTDISTDCDDCDFGPYSIGFNFPFYESSYTEFYLNTNGYIYFGEDIEYEDGYISWADSDLDPGNGGTIHMQNFGSYIVLQFTDYWDYDEYGKVTAELILHSNGNITMQYLSVDDDFPNSEGGWIGLWDEINENELIISDYEEGYLHDELAIKIKMPQKFYTEVADGTVIPGGSKIVDVVFDSEGVYKGIYHGILTVTGNDYANPSDDVTLTMEVLNSAPIAEDVATDTYENVAIAIPLAGSDVDGDELTYTVLTLPANGTYADGIYTPDAGWFGIDTFTYKVNDGEVDSEVGTITITVIENNEPIFTSIPITEVTVGNGYVYAPIVEDVDGDDVTITVPTLPDWLNYGTVSLGSGFSHPQKAVLASDGKIYIASSNDIKRMDADGTNIESLGSGLYNPLGVFVMADGTIYVADSENHSIKRMDADGTNIVTLGSGFYRPRNVFVTDNKIYVADKQNNVIKQMDFDGTNIEILASGFYEPTGLHVTEDKIYFTAAGSGSNTVRRMNLDGTNIEMCSSGTFSYPQGIFVTNDNMILVADFSNNAVKYTTFDNQLLGTPTTEDIGTHDVVLLADDGNGGNTSQEFVITVNSINTAPVAQDVEVTTDEDVAEIFQLMGSDADNHNYDLVYTIVTPPAHGVAEVLEVEWTEYTPNVNWSGTDSFTYMVSDSTSNSNIATVTITVNSVIDDPELALPTSLTFAEDGFLETDLGAYISNPEGYPLTYFVSGNEYIRVSLENGIVTFTAESNWFGSEILTFTIFADDRVLITDDVLVVVESQNDEPTIVIPDISFAEDGYISLNVSGFIGDVDGDDLVLSASETTNIEVGITEFVVTIISPENWFGSETVTFTVSDGVENRTIATDDALITVTSVNDAPLANDIEITTNEDEDAWFHLTGSDVEGDEITFTIVDAPTNGTASVDADAEVNYIPNAGWFGVDTFTYVANDGELDSELAMVTITVNEVLAPPPAPTNVRIVVTVDDVGHVVRTISWDLAVGVDFYNVYVCDTPDGEFVQLNEEPIIGTTFESVGGSIMKFYRVTANNGGIVTVSPKKSNFRN